MIQTISKKIFQTSRYTLMMAVTLLLIFGASCKSKKQASDVSDPDAERAKMEQEAKARREEEERRKAEEARLAVERERARAEAEARANRPENRLANYFDAIANASSASAANGSINEALAMFSSPETPVLIVISEENGQKDYDRPTTIKDYLNYLKDQKKDADRISELKVNSSGKITEVELVK